MTRVSVNRILSGWGTDGLIEHGRGYVIVPDLEKLEAAVESARA